MNIELIEPGDAQYPQEVLNRLGKSAPATVNAMGHLGLLQHRRLGLICSIRCPGSVIIKTYDTIRALRDAGVVVAGGFHSPMERECLELLLRGSQPVILCPARRLSGLRIGQEGRRAIKEGRLLVLSIFSSSATRTISAQAVLRNEFVAALVDAVLVPHAAQGGRAELTAQQVLGRGQAVFTFADEENAELIRLGAKPYEYRQLTVALGAIKDSQRLSS